MRKLKPSFDDYEIEPSPQVWMKIESRLDESPKKRIGWFFYGIAVAVFMGAVLYITLFYDIEIKLKPKQVTNEISLVDASEKNLISNVQSPIESSSPGTDKKINSESNHSETAERKIPEKKVDSKNNQTDFRRINHSTTSRNTQIAIRKSTVLKQTHTPMHPSSIVEEIPQQENITASNDERTSVEKMEMINSSLFVEEPSFMIEPRENEPMKTKKVSASRWQILLIPSGEYNYRVINFTSVNSTMTDEQKNYFNNEKGIYSWSLAAFCNYSLSTQFSITAGVDYFTSGQERSESKVTYVNPNPYFPADPVYSINTSLGNTSGNGQQFDAAAFTGNNSAFPNSSLTLPNQTYSVTQNFKLRQQFYFIDFPFMIQYSGIEHRFTPYGAMGFSLGFLLDEKILLNGERLDYKYSQTLNTFLPFAEAKAGMKYRLSNHFSAHLQSSLRYGLTSINSNPDVKWYPYAVGLGAGLGYRF